MRLRKIKMAGFKSFVDPTTILFPSNMVGVVGPNGCGKSNIIDAVRWVMGASSRHLRGDSMEDVIFNGASSRKPVGQASIELVFDNSEGRAGGQYARYNEVSIRRLVTRDGQSKYFFNGTRCRRRDITDIFLGTGLGPRSYAIIEQGMISRLIEAKPEELRVYLEEAAGISKYKERRRETENRIRHTRENMDRLNDLREEVEKQLKRLKRQANTAERYKALKQDERRVKAELLALRWQALDHEEQAHSYNLRNQETRLDEVTARLRTFEAEMEREREALIEANAAFNEVQVRYYGLGGDISRTEQSIQHLKEIRAQQQEEFQKTQQSYERNQQEMASDQARLRQLADNIATLEPEHASVQAKHAEAAQRFNQLDQTMSGWQQRWEDLINRLSGPSEKVQVERTRIEHLERQLTQLGQRETRLKDELASLLEQSLQADIEQLEAKRLEATAVTERYDHKLKSILQSIGERRERNLDLNQRLDEARGQHQNLRGRLASLEALQEAALGKRQEDIIEWLHLQELGAAARLGEQLLVEPGWERAIEMVMGQYLEAICVNGVDVVAGVLGSLEHGHLVLFDMMPEGAFVEQTIHRSDTMLGKVQAPWPLVGILDGIYVVDTLEQALVRRHTLAPYESVVTREGIWIGKNWLRVARDPDEHAGVLAREKEIKDLAERLAEVSQNIEVLQLELSQGRETLQQLECAREQEQAACNRAHRAQSEAEFEVNQRRNLLEQVIARKVRLKQELDEIRSQYSLDQAALVNATQTRNGALEKLNTLTDERELLETERERLRTTLEEARNQSRQHREASHQLALRLEAMRSARTSTQQGIDRMEGQFKSFQLQMENLQSKLDETIEPLQLQQQELEALLSRRVDVEQALTEARNHVQSVEEGLRKQDQKRLSTERELETLRSEQDALRMAWQEVSVRCRTLKEQVAESGFDLHTLISEMREDAQLEAWEQRVHELHRQIERLGPINLAAIDEYEEQNQRKQYLDSQHKDLSEALDTLENAIHKIDKETKHRFKETFERVNKRLQEIFPRLFGGGQAHLTMTEENLLTTGISIMARPPGKRLSTIHLMSGGEKALAAVAMVFAIFELNPAPFCMLDEVDAPLDETNVDRFSEVVKEMADNVQFIFITHNKITMEYADQLIGVTMHEPGVSRLVAVDVDEAVQMAAG